MIQKRSIGLAILFTVITCGFYALYWLVKINDEANTLSETEGMSGGIVLLLTIVTGGLFGIYWAYKIGKTMETAQELKGVKASDNSILYLILSLFGLGIIVYAIVQSDINALVA